MLAQLSSLKTRLGLLETDTQYDSLLTGASEAISQRFDKECNRAFARTENFTQEFSADMREIAVACYPLETISKFEVKSSEAEGWLECAGVKHLVRNRCIISLESALGRSDRQLARVTYTGGYVLPGATVAPGQTPLPKDVEQAAMEQAAYWFQSRDRLGLLRIWEYHGTYRQFEGLDLLESVRALLWQYRRWEM